MWATIGLVFFSIIVLWIMALNIDAKFFNGRFLIKDKTSGVDLKRNLRKVLNQKGKPKENWDSDVVVWFFDYFFNVPLMNPEFEAIRGPIVDSIKRNENESSLDDQTFRLVEEAVAKLERIGH
jgi:hypothetical protein